MTSCRLRILQDPQPQRELDSDSWTIFRRSQPSVQAPRQHAHPYWLLATDWPVAMLQMEPIPWCRMIDLGAKGSYSHFNFYSKWKNCKEWAGRRLGLPSDFAKSKLPRFDIVATVTITCQYLSFQCAILCRMWIGTLLNQEVNLHNACIFQTSNTSK